MQNPLFYAYDLCGWVPDCLISSRTFQDRKKFPHLKVKYQYLLSVCSADYCMQVNDDYLLLLISTVMWLFYVSFDPALYI